MSVTAWETWREARDKQFREPGTWTSFRSLTWLTAEPVAIPGTPGRWWTDGDAVHVAPAPDDAEPLVLAETGEPVVAETVVEAGPHHSLWALRYGGPDSGRVAVELLFLADPDGTAHRGVRPRDPENPLVEAFAGIPVFDYDPAWVVTATVLHHDRPIAAEVGSAQPRLRFRVSVVGEIDLPLPTLPAGDAVTLQVIGEREGVHEVRFSDTAEGVAPWRTIRFDADDIAADGTVELDLNLVQNYPSGVAPHCICPRELPANRLAIPVPVGERSARF
ncbi:MAG: DUF1684 domain-containing protein [Nocardioides sp.]|uniref:DUF1684 domain-containing protein n=1 Tax=Nocardioides sp. TaxID=35761 RepID=UPI0039E4FE14